MGREGEGREYFSINLQESILMLANISAFWLVFMSLTFATHANIYCYRNVKTL